MGAATDSAYGYKDAVNKWYVTKLQEDNQFQLASSYTISSDGKLGDIVIPISGDKPSGGYLNYSNNTLTGGCLVIGDYAVTFEGGNATSTIKGDCSSSSNNSGNESTMYDIFELGTLVYFDPVSNDTCDSTTFDLDDINSGDSTCYKWRVITTNDTENNSTITLQLDHNLVNTVYWNNESGEKLNNYGPKTLLKSLTSVTSAWTRVPPLNYTYDTTVGGTNIWNSNDYSGSNYGVLTCTNGMCIITCDANDSHCSTSGAVNTTQLHARVITAEEIAKIMQFVNQTGQIDWTLVNADYLNIQNINWLYENTGSNNNYNNSELNYGYWTLSPVSIDGDDSAWEITIAGYLSYNYVYDELSELPGARPVITISKTLLGE